LISSLAPARRRGRRNGRGDWHRSRPLCNPGVSGARSSACGSIVDEPGVPAPETTGAARATVPRCAVVADLAESHRLRATRGLYRSHRYRGEACNFALMIAGPDVARRTLDDRDHEVRDPDVDAALEGPEQRDDLSVHERNGVTDGHQRRVVAAAAGGEPVRRVGTVDQPARVVGTVG